MPKDTGPFPSLSERVAPFELSRWPVCPHPQMTPVRLPPFSCSRAVFFGAAEPRVSLTFDYYNLLQSSNVSNSIRNCRHVGFLMQVAGLRSGGQNGL
jgi:hypothetical protein